MKTPCLISVIVPVYNVASYLNRFFATLQAQSLQAWRCVLADDGSKDESGLILDEFARVDGRVMIVHQPNRGVSVARNRGLDRISTPYFTFVDPDDWIEENHLTRLYQAVEKKEGCVAVVGFMDHRFNSTSITPWSSPLPSGIYPMSVPLIYELGTLWNKLFPTKTLAKLRFSQDLEFGEDIVFQTLLLSHVEYFCLDMECRSYHYMRRPVSLAHGRTRLDSARRYWDDSRVLYQNREQLQLPSVFREWMFRSMASHLTTLCSLHEALSLARLFSTNEARIIWRTMWTIPYLSGDDRFCPGHRAQAGGYGLIFGWVPSVPLKAVAFWGWNWGWRLLSLGKRGVWRGWRRLWEGMSSNDSLSK